MTTDGKRSRLAGLLYLILAPTTGFWYVTGRFFMTGDAATVLSQVVAGRTRLEFSIVAGAIGAIDFLVLGIVFYWLFSATGKLASSLLLGFVAASVPIFLIAVSRQMDVLSLLDQSQAVLGRDQLQAQVLMALHSYNNLFIVTNIFSGLWLIPLGWLVFRCGFMPRTLGVLLVTGSVFYLGSFIGPVFVPQYETTMLGRVIGVLSGVPGFAGELGTIVWLLVRGVPDHKTAMRLAEAPV
jgi:hypothetical protein